MTALFLLFILAVSVSAENYVCPESVACVRKCCPLGEMYDRDSRSCKNETKPLVLPLEYEDGSEGRASQEDLRSERWMVFTGTPTCPDGTGRILVTRNAKVDTIRILPDGHLTYLFPHVLFRTRRFTVDHYCIDNVAQTGKVVGMNALVCYPIDKQNDKTVSVSGMIVSSVFILVTMCVYAAVPELCNAQGRVLMAYLGSLLVGFVLLPTLQFLHKDTPGVHPLCVPFTFIIYYSMLAAFFWLNVMSYDILRGLSKFKRTRGFSRRRYLVYCAYAFGFPLLLTLLLATFEYWDDYFEPKMPDYIVIPNLRHTHTCFMAGDTRLLYMYIPMMVICTANTFLFIATALLIYRVKKETNILKLEDSLHKERFLIYARLFVIMGLSWMLEVISSLYPDASVLWTITDLFNVLVGFNIFVIFVCKRRTFDYIKKRYYEARGIQPNSQTSSSTRNTSIYRDEIKLQSANPANQLM